MRKTNPIIQGMGIGFGLLLVNGFIQFVSDPDRFMYGDDHVRFREANDAVRASTCRIALAYHTQSGKPIEEFECD